MGGSQSVVLDEDAEPEVDLRPATEAFLRGWRDRPVPTSLRELAGHLGFEPDGVKAMLSQYPETEASFFAKTLPFAVEMAARLPELLPQLALPKLAQGCQASLPLPRTLVASLLAHMFLCTTSNSKRRRGCAMPKVSFDHLLACSEAKEIAKLRMFVQYFDRLREAMPSGQLRIYRQVRTQLAEAERQQAWASSEKLLLPMEVVPMGIGFEDPAWGEGCLHADFANMFLGGGVLSRGCVQEEIRFAICPELCAAMLVCPCMLPNEAITVVGGEQFSSYKGYASSLEYDGPFENPRCRRDVDGTPLVAITAMDALDFRGADASLETQMKSENELRELEKAAAAFAPVDEEALRTWPVVATGNWGCGAFLGSLPLKAALQWLAASEGGRRLRYFPFQELIGDELAAMSKELCAAGVTVGQLFTALQALAARGPRVREPELLRALLERCPRAGPGAGRAPARVGKAKWWESCPC